MMRQFSIGDQRDMKLDRGLFRPRKKSLNIPNLVRSSRKKFGRQASVSTSSHRLFYTSHTGDPRKKSSISTGGKSDADKERHPGKYVTFETTTSDRMESSEASIVQTSSPLQADHRSSSSFSSSSASSMVCCRFCNRFYGSASILIHSRSCKQASDLEMRKLAAQKAWEQKSTQPPARPPGRICHICGRRYTNASFELHLSRCLKQWNTWNSMLPRLVRHTRIPFSPHPTDEELTDRIDKARCKGYSVYGKAEALDDIMREASETNRLPLEFIN